MKARLQNLWAIGLAVLLTACVVAWLTTRDANPLADREVESGFR